MSDIDHVFARLGGRHVAAADQRELRRLPAKRRSTSRVVEVVRLPTTGSAPPPSASHRTAANVRSQTWEDGFPAKSATAPSSAPTPKAMPDASAEPIAHVMPAWAPSTPAAEKPRPEEPRPAVKQADTAARRRVADPFDVDDDGANCLRCGYMVEKARERAGLMTCSDCG